MRRGLTDHEARATTSDPECAERFGIPLGTDADYVLQRGPAGLELALTAAPGSKPLRVDFADPALLRRATRGRQMVLRAVGAKGRDWTVVDGTAGLGRDAFVLASRGLPTTMVERSPILAALLDDALRRCPVRGLSLRYGDSLSAPLEADVVYLDPMYPEGEKAALNKLELRVLRDLAGEDADADALFAHARATARRRVVVKRPKHAPPLGATPPSHVLRGKAVRWDVYLS